MIISLLVVDSVHRTANIDYTFSALKGLTDFMHLFCISSSIGGNINNTGTAMVWYFNWEIENSNAGPC